MLRADFPRLEDSDLSRKLSKDEESKRLGRAQRRLLHLRLINGGQLREGKLGPPVCVVFEGWDAAGKGGAIKRLVEPLDPRHVHVAPFAAPTPDELRHHFLWRFWPPLPGWGGMTIFDRSWYGRVLVERVESLATEVQWRRAYQEINDFEHTLAEEGMIVIKLWMHMSHEEQLRRFVRRRDDRVQVVEAHRRGLAQPGEAGGLRRGRVRHAAPDPRLARPMGRGLFGEQAQRSGRGDRDGHPAHGGGHGTLGRPRAASRRRRGEDRARAGVRRRGIPAGSGLAAQWHPRCGNGLTRRHRIRHRHRLKADTGVDRPTPAHRPRSDSRHEPRTRTPPDPGSRSPSTGSRSTPTANGSPACASSATRTSGRPRSTAPTGSLPSPWPPHGSRS